MRKLPIDRLLEIAPNAPYEVLNDVKNRMGDWILSGGNQDDPYMWQQVHFVERFINFNGDK